MKHLKHVEGDCQEKEKEFLNFAAEQNNLNNPASDQRPAENVIFCLLNKVTIGVTMF